MILTKLASWAMQSMKMGCQPVGMVAGLAESVPREERSDKSESTRAELAEAVAPRSGSIKIAAGVDDLHDEAGDAGLVAGSREVPGQSPFDEFAHQRLERGAGVVGDGVGVAQLAVGVGESRGTGVGAGAGPGVDRVGFDQGAQGGTVVDRGADVLAQLGGALDDVAELRSEGVDVDAGAGDGVGVEHGEHDQELVAAREPGGFAGA